MTENLSELTRFCGLGVIILALYLATAKDEEATGTMKDIFFFFYSRSGADDSGSEVLRLSEGDARWARAQTDEGSCSRITSRHSPVSHPSAAAFDSLERGGVFVQQRARAQ